MTFVLVLSFLLIKINIEVKYLVKIHRKGLKRTKDKGLPLNVASMGLVHSLPMLPCVQDLEHRAEYVLSVACGPKGNKTEQTLHKTSIC